MHYVELLKNYGLKVTPQRLSVLQILDRHHHPTVDELYEEIKRSNPSVSLATVYKNLNTLKDEGLVVEVNLVNQKSRYDIYENPHIHIICKKCGKVYDLAHDEAGIVNYQKYLEKTIDSDIEGLNLIAQIKNCKQCM